jgi:hypothetical protein
VNLFLVASGDLVDFDPPPFFPGREVERWGDRARWIAHGDEYGQVSDDRAVLWSGHPEGRFARVSWDRRSGEWQVDADPMGSYPVYSNGDAISNNPTVLRRSSGLRPEVIASLVGGGWSLSGDPLWDGVSRIDSGLDVAEVVPLLGAGFDVDAAARDLVEVIGALGDWPGRPNVVPLTAGRDSRIVLAAALRAGMDFSANTGGVPGEPDVDVGRALAARAGVPHYLIEDDPHGSLYSHWRQAAELLAFTAGGTATLADAVGFPLGPRPGPLPLWHSGQGGEIARGYYGGVATGSTDDLVPGIYRAFVMRRSHRAELLSDEGQELVRGQIAEFVRSVLGAGAAVEDVPDLFYLLQRMGRWAGPTHGAVEYVRDTTSPLWHRRMLPHLLGLPAAERAREEFHRRMLERLAPELAEVGDWVERRSEMARRVERGTDLARKAGRELRRRARARRPASSVAASPADPFAAVLPEIRDLVLSQPDHVAWTVVDRARAEAVLSSDAVALDEVRRYQVWRLATVFTAT